LIDLREAPSNAMHSMMLSLLADLGAEQHGASPVHGLMHHGFSLLGRKVAERRTEDGEPYIARNRGQYRAVLRAGLVGGTVTVGAVAVKLAGGSGSFTEGVLVSLGYAASFLLIPALGGVLAAKQPAITAPALAAKMGNVSSREGARDLLQEIAGLLRAQAAAMFGNVAAVATCILLVTLATLGLFGKAPMPAAQAHAELRSLSLFGVTPLSAAFTGVLLWAAAIAAGLADNWFVLRQLRSTIAHHRRLVYALGAPRAARLAQWMEAHAGSIVGNVALAALLGLAPAVLRFFGVPLDIRHATLSAGSLTAAAGSLGWENLASPEFWLAAGGVIAVAFLNVATAFGCALMLALRARNVPGRVRRFVWRALLRRFVSSPLSFFIPPKQERVLALVPGSRRKPLPVDDSESKTGS
jgi:site-specific recombinase